MTFDWTEWIVVFPPPGTFRCPARTKYLDKGVDMTLMSGYFLLKGSGMGLEIPKSLADLRPSKILMSPEML